jgi:hypothetical protein
LYGTGQQDANSALQAALAGYNNQYKTWSDSQASNNNLLSSLFSGIGSLATGALTGGLGSLFSGLGTGGNLLGDMSLSGLANNTSNAYTNPLSTYYTTGSSQYFPNWGF